MNPSFVSCSVSATSVAIYRSSSQCPSGTVEVTWFRFAPICVVMLYGRRFNFAIIRLLTAVSSANTFFVVVCDFRVKNSKREWAYNPFPLFVAVCLSIKICYRFPITARYLVSSSFTLGNRKNNPIMFGKTIAKIIASEKSITD